MKKQKRPTKTKANRAKLSALDRLLTSKPFLILMFVLGVMIFIYPLISNKYYEIKQEKQVQEYEQMLNELPTAEGKRIIAQAQEYNRKLAGLDADIFSSKHLKGITELVTNGEMPSFFSAGRLIGSVTIPKIRAKLPIRVGTTEQVLSYSAGFLVHTSLPVGGKSTHSVITAHRGLPQARLFTDLDLLKNGDVFLIQVLDKPHAYQVDQIKVVKPDDTSALQIVEGEDYTTLLTCTPYMINTHRLLVRGHRIPYTPELEDKIKQDETDGFWALFMQKYREYIIGIAIFLMLLLAITIKEKLKRKGAKG